MKWPLSCALGAVLALAGCQQQQQQSAKQDAAAAQPGGPPPMTGDPAKNPDMTALARQVDSDGNGQLARAEWQAQGLPESSFNMFEQGRGYVTLADYQKNAAPPGIDINGDGTLTVEEFKQFDRQMAAQMSGKDGKAPPRP